MEAEVQSFVLNQKGTGDYHTEVALVPTPKG